MDTVNGSPATFRGPSLSSPTPSPSPHPTTNASSTPTPTAQGVVTQKRLTGKSRRNLLLVKPSSTEDILAIRDELATLERGKSLKSLDELGAKRTQMGPEEGPLEARLSEKKSTKQEFKFICDTSPDYQQWITALKDAYRETFGLDDEEDDSSDYGRRARSTSRRRNSSVGRKSTTSRRPPSRSIERESTASRGRGDPRDRGADYDYYEYEARGPPKNRPASVRSGRSVRSTASTRTTTPRAPGDSRAPRSSSRPNGSSRPKAPGDGGSRKRSSSAANRVDDGRRKSTSGRGGYYDDADDYRRTYRDDDDDDGRSIRSTRSTSAPMNVMGPNGQPLRSSLSRPKSNSTGNLNGHGDFEREAPIPYGPGSDDVFEITKKAMEAGMVETPPPSPAIIQVVNQPSSDQHHSDVSGGEESIRKGSSGPYIPSAPPSDHIKRPAGHAMKPGFATRSGSLVRFSGYDESIVISPDDAIHLRRPTLRGSSTTDLAPQSPDVAPIKSRSIPSSPSMPAPGTPRQSMAVDRRRPSSNVQSPNLKQRSRTPSIADQKRVVNSLFDDTTESSKSTAEPRGRATFGVQIQAPEPASRLSQSRPSTGGRDADVASISSKASRTSRSSSVGARMPSGGQRRNSEVSTSSTIRAVTNVPEKEKEKSKFAFSSLFGGKKEKMASSETVNVTDNGGNEGRKRSSSGTRRRSSSSSLTGPNLLASLTLVPSVRVDKTQSLASMFRKGATDVSEPIKNEQVMISPTSVAAASNELARVAARTTESPISAHTPTAPTASAVLKAQPSIEILSKQVEEPATYSSAGSANSIQEQPVTPKPSPQPVPATITIGSTSPAPTMASFRPSVPPNSPQSILTASSSGTYTQEQSGVPVPPVRHASAPSTTPMSSSGIPPLPSTSNRRPADGVSIVSVNDRESLDSDSEEDAPTPIPHRSPAVIPVPAPIATAVVPVPRKEPETAYFPTPPPSSFVSPQLTPKIEAKEVEIDNPTPLSPKANAFGKKLFGRMATVGSKEASPATSAPSSPNLSLPRNTSSSQPSPVAAVTTSNPSLERNAGTSAFRKAFDTFNKKVREFSGPPPTPAGPVVKKEVEVPREAATATLLGTNESDDEVPLGKIVVDEVGMASPKALRRLGVVNGDARKAGEVVMVKQEETEEDDETDEETRRAKREAKGKARAE
ncbi:hypothetical protein BC829DRAFT_443382 [Chytridium lagenaria]|nr:hypothetical protein BC829DRAFT_443382 [Chytridium lagenaria]